jgi:hypothetical protein
VRIIKKDFLAFGSSMNCCSLLGFSDQFDFDVTLTNRQYLDWKLFGIMVTIPGPIFKERAH